MVTEQNRILFCYHFLLNSSAVQYRMWWGTVKFYRKRALYGEVGERRKSQI